MMDVLGKRNKYVPQPSTASGTQLGKRSVANPSCVSIVFKGGEDFRIPYDTLKEAEMIVKDIHFSLTSGLKAKIYHDRDGNPLLVIFENIIFTFAVPTNCE